MYIGNILYDRLPQNRQADTFISIRYFFAQNLPKAPIYMTRNRHDHES